MIQSYPAASPATATATGAGGRQSRMAGRFPAFMGGGGPVLQQLIATVAGPLDAVDRAVHEVLESHWPERAGGGDLERIGALAGVPRRAGEPVDGYRRRLLARVAAWLRYGSSPRGVLEAVAAELNLEMQRSGGELLLREVDAYRRQARTVAGELLELQEQPQRLGQQTVGGAFSPNHWTVVNAGLDPLHPGRTAPTLTLVAEARTVQPLVVNLTTGEAVGYRGVVEAGSRLDFPPTGPALLDGRETADVYRLEGVYYDAIGSGSPFFVTKADGAPGLPVGESHWVFFAGYDPDANQYDTSAPGNATLTLLWQERQPCSFVLGLDRRLGGAQPEAVLQLAAAAIAQVRAAGVEARVEWLDAAPTGTIRAAVTDERGQLLSGAEVAVTPLDGSGQHLAAALQGDAWILGGLDEGVYQVMATAAGYMEDVRVVTMTAPEVAQLPFTLVRLVTVPDLTAGTLEAGLTALGEQSLTDIRVADENTKVVNMAAPDIYRSARVLQQRPAAGQVVPVTQPVELIVQAMTVMPDLAGKSGLSAALATLKGIAVEGVTDSEEKPVDFRAVPAHYTGAKVVEQAPGPGPMPVSTRVRLRVQAMRSMPNLMNVALGQARQLLGELPLAALSDSDGVTLDPANLPSWYVNAPVMAQSPAAGPVPTGTPVTFQVRAMVQMPDLAGMTLEQALTSLPGLTVDTVTDNLGQAVAFRALPDHYKVAKVLTQIPAPKPVPKGSRVILQVQAMRMMPHVVGAVGLSQALQMLGDLPVQSLTDSGGATLNRFSLPAWYTGAPVLAQSPAAGPVPAGTPVALQVQAMVQMPDLAGKSTLGQALSMLSGLTLEAITDTLNASLNVQAVPEHYKAGMVLQQLPAPGPVPKGTGVRLHVQAMRSMPYLANVGLSQALQMIGDLPLQSLTDSNNVVLNRSSLPWWYNGAPVLNQSPAAGPVPAGTPVTLRVHAMVAMPDVRGQVLSAARSQLPAGLPLGAIHNSLGQGFTPENLPAHFWVGYATGQEPAPGSAQRYGTGVTLHQTMVQVPSLSTSYTTATSQLQSVGLRINVIREEPTTDSGKWVYGGYSPGAGTWLPTNAEVEYYLRWQPSTILPDYKQDQLEPW